MIKEIKTVLFFIAFILSLAAGQKFEINLKKIKVNEGTWNKPYCDDKYGDGSQNECDLLFRLHLCTKTEGCLKGYWNYDFEKGSAVYIVCKKNECKTTFKDHDFQGKGKKFIKQVNDTYFRKANDAYIKLDVCDEDGKWSNDDHITTNTWFPLRPEEGFSDGRTISKKFFCSHYGKNECNGYEINGCDTVRMIYTTKYKP
jgi:hypothetical protein